MASVAVFVDAGYLFAQGSAVLSGSKKPRSSLQLNETAVMSELAGVASTKSNGLPLLRVYWYDAARGNQGLTPDHETLAHTDYVKLRLGFLNNEKQQKGVDSLIVTDLIELARNRAMSDAVVMAGDEDVRIGVQIAQGFGVRVHLLGIKPSRGSQSLQLMQEADTTTEWDAAHVGRFLTVRPDAAAGGATSAYNEHETSTTDPFAPVIANMVAALTTSDIAHLGTFWQSRAGLPPEMDGRLIATCRTIVRRDLTTAEKRDVRRRFQDAVEARLPA